jgi:hypothetical protein
MNTEYSLTPKNSSSIDINEKTDEIFGYILCSQIEAAKAVSNVENEVINIYFL